jgi:hypothetical protein
MTQICVVTFYTQICVFKFSMQKCVRKLMTQICVVAESLTSLVCVKRYRGGGGSTDRLPGLGMSATRDDVSLRRRPILCPSLFASNLACTCMHPVSVLSLSVPHLLLMPYGLSYLMHQPQCPMSVHLAPRLSPLPDLPTMPNSSCSSPWTHEH